MDTLELIELPEGLGLQTKAEKFNPLVIDFTAGKYAYRRTVPGKELIAKAIGLKKNQSLTVIDATAGLGRDAFVLASLGCDVTMIERSSYLQALLADALARAKTHENIADIISRMHLIAGDAKTLLPTLQADVVFLDPMYPHREKSALVKKEMRLLRAAVGDDDDATELLTLALNTAKQRVVVKRPRLGVYLADKKPDFSYEGNHSRFDVYLVQPSSL